MTGDDDRQDAVARLEKALSRLEAAVGLHLNRQRGLFDVDEEVQRVNADRAKLAQELDLTTDRAQRLEKANSEVSRRLVDVMETLRLVVDA